ncbi:MerR family transcriptional regulator [Comamonas granuli]|uniref:MerR family transcriptional regulator n=1 Tax=Comamonas granuli TaxID=290309 RepID=UPI0005A696E5|nr:cobalamin-dependent protein [Comamonas granuli]
MSALPSGTEPAGLPIAAVERETGLAKDTLRVWEKRYGFPQPLRDTAGDRLYPAEQVQQLQLIRRLLDAGLRPGKVVGLDPSALQALLGAQAASARAPLSRTKPTSSPPSASLAPLLDAIGAHDPQALRHALSHAQLRMGLAPFVTELVAPLATAVGEAWAQGRFEVFEEHLFTEVITGVLRQAIAALAPLPAAPASAGPKVLLTTLPQELHGLGLLMVEALLALEGCTCVSLGTQTPLADVVQAAQAHQADVVALSFTAVHSGPLVLASLRELRAQLPADTALWVGGSCAALYQKPLEGISAVQPLSALAPLVAQWRSRRAPPALGPKEPAA